MPVNNYFDLIIQGNSYNIVESSHKPQTRDSALATLKKIERIVKGNFSYIGQLDDFDLKKLLLEKAELIHTGYTAKLSKVNWLFQKIFGKEKEVSKLHSNISSILNPPDGLNIQNDVMPCLAKEMSLRDLAALARTNKKGQAQARIGFISRAQRYGYEGSDETQAKMYIRDVLAQFKQSQLFIRENSLFVDIQLESLLKKLPCEQFLSLLSLENIYPNYYDKLRKAFLAFENWESDSDLSCFLNNALLMACKKSDFLTAVMLLDRGADPQSKATTYDALIMIICKTTLRDKNYITLITKIVNRKNFDPNKQMGGLNYLHAAVLKNDSVTANILLDNQADIDGQDGKGMTPLMYVLFNDSTELVKRLIDRGANVHLKNNAGSSAIHFAAQRGNFEMVELLLSKGVNINDKGVDGGTPLLFACGLHKRKELNPKVVELLLLNGADPDIVGSNLSGPIHFAAQLGNAEVVDLLIKGKANVNARGDGKATPLIFACGSGRENYAINRRVVELLIEAGADSNRLNSRGESALLLAHRHNQPEVVGILDRLNT